MGGKPTTPSGPSQDYFAPPSSPFFANIYSLLLPLVISHDHIIHNIQQFFGVRYRGVIFSPAPSLPEQAQYDLSNLHSPPQNTLGHPLWSPYRAWLPIHVVMCAASELGNELFYGIWVLTTATMFETNVALPLLLLWSLGLFVTQLVKDSVHLPRPGLQYWNKASKQHYLQPPPLNQRIYRLETHYEAEFGFPSAHCVGSILGLYTLISLHFDYIPTSSAINLLTLLPVEREVIPLFTTISELTRRVLQALCLFWFVMTPISRLYCGVHSLLDILGGLTISLLCMCFIMVIKYLGMTAWLATSFWGITTLFVVILLACYCYPKHSERWVNSSGDSSLVMGTTLGCAISFYIRYISNSSLHDLTAAGSFRMGDLYNMLQSDLLRHAAKLGTDQTTKLTQFIAQTASNTISLPVIQVLKSISPITQLTTATTSSPHTEFSPHFLPYHYTTPLTPYGLIHPPYFFPVDLTSPSLSVIFFSISLGVAAFFIRNVVVLVISYIVKDVVIRTPIFKLARVLLGYSSQFPPKIDITSNNHNRSTSISSTPTPTPTPTPLSSTSTFQSPAHCSLEQITAKDSDNMNQLVNRKELTANNTPQYSQQQPQLNPNLPPINSTLFKNCYDMAIIDINQIDMIDKLVGYAALGILCNVVFQPLSEQLFGSFYYLCAPF